MWRKMTSAVGQAWDGNSVEPGRRGTISRALTIWLVALWVLAFGDLTWLTLIGGILVALAVQWFFPLPHVTRHWRVRPIKLTVLVLRFVWDLVRAGIEVSWLVLTNRSVDNAIIRVELRSCDPVHMTIVSAMTSLVPGSIVIKIDRLTGTIYLHVLDIESQGGVDGARSRVLDQERRMLEAIARPVDLRALGIPTTKERIVAKKAQREGRQE